MENKSFSKTGLLVILVILIGGGILIWYLGMQKAEKPPEKKLLEEKKPEVSTEAIDKFMNLRLKEDSRLYSYFPGYAPIIHFLSGEKGLVSYSRIVLLSPHIKRYEIVEGKEIEPSKFRFEVKTYLGKEKDFGYYDEKITFGKIRGKPVITSFKQSEYTSLIEEDPCQNVSQERTYIGVWAIPCTKKEVCYWRLAMEEKNPGICKKIESKVAKDYCHQEIALIKDDLSLCNQIEAKRIRKHCQKEVRFWRKREELNGQYSPYQPEPIEEWKTYRNEQYGFKLKYPEGSKIEELTKPGEILRIDLPFTPKTKLKEKYLKIIITENRPTLLINPPLETKRISIKKINFTKRVSEDHGHIMGGTYEDYYALKDNKYFNLNFTLGYAIASSPEFAVNSPQFKTAWELMDFDKNQESVIFDKILSTFRFTR